MTNNLRSVPLPHEIVLVRESATTVGRLNLPYMA